MQILHTHNLTDGQAPAKPELSTELETQNDGSPTTLPQSPPPAQFEIGLTAALARAVADDDGRAANDDETQAPSNSKHTFTAAYYPSKLGTANTIAAIRANSLESSTATFFLDELEKTELEKLKALLKEIKKQDPNLSDLKKNLAKSETAPRGVLKPRALGIGTVEETQEEIAARLLKALSENPLIQSKLTTQYQNTNIGMRLAEIAKSIANDKYKADLGQYDIEHFRKLSPRYLGLVLLALEARLTGDKEQRLRRKDALIKAAMKASPWLASVGLGVLLWWQVDGRNNNEKPGDTTGTNNPAINTNNPSSVPIPHQRPEEFKFKIVNKIANQLINTELGLDAPGSIANQVVFRGERFDKAYLLVDRSGTFQNSLAGRSGTDDVSKFIIKLGELLNKHYISSVKAADILVAFTDPLTPDLARKPAMIVKRNYNYNGVNKEYTVLVLSRELVATNSSMSKEQLAKVTDIVEAYMRADKLGALDTYRQDSDGNLDPAILTDLKKLN